jgi:hypothetical protein
MLRSAFKGVKYLHIKGQTVQEGFLTLKIGKHRKIPNYCTKFYTCSFNTSWITKKKKKKDDESFRMSTMVQYYVLWKRYLKNL